MSRAIIVGAGINGLCAAFYLMKNGWSVTVFDGQGERGSGASSDGAHRMLNPMDGSKLDADVVDSLPHLHEIITTIGSSAFEKTGVRAMIEEHVWASPRSQRLHKLSTREMEHLPVLTNRGGDQTGILINFHDFGVILASSFISRLRAWLSRHGVAINANSTIQTINSHAGYVETDRKRKTYGDVIIIAAGCGNRELLITDPAMSPLAEQLNLTSMRCYVLYARHRLIQPADRTSLTFAPIGKSGVWGVGPIRNIPLKLGCSAATHPASMKRSPSDTIELFRQSISDSLPSLADFEVIDLAFNHWTSISTDKRFHRVGNCYVVTNDNGGGFKTAPLAMLKMVRNIYKNLKDREAIETVKLMPF